MRSKGISMLIVYVLLLATAGCAVRAVSVYVVHNHGVFAGSVLLAMIFLVGRHLAIRYDM